MEHINKKKYQNSLEIWFAFVKKIQLLVRGKSEKVLHSIDCATLSIPCTEQKYL